MWTVIMEREERGGNYRKIRRVTQMELRLKNQALPLLNKKKEERKWKEKIQEQSQGSDNSWIVIPCSLNQRLQPRCELTGGPWNQFTVQFLLIEICYHSSHFITLCLIVSHEAEQFNQVEGRSNVKHLKSDLKVIKWSQRDTNHIKTGKQERFFS